NDPATPEIYTLSLHDALPISRISMEPVELTDIDLVALARRVTAEHVPMALKAGGEIGFTGPDAPVWIRGSEPAIAVALSNLNRRSEEHTSELQSQSNLVCRLL